jgi:CxxC-x17-CxxC domain-containing protein
MHQGNWKCSTCGGPITELPFIPRSEAGLTCRACYSKQRGGSAPQAAPTIATADEVPDIPFEAGLASEPDYDDGFGPAITPASSSGEKPRYSGDWQCAGCGTAITSLPFTPRDTSNLKCIDCFKKSRG